MSPQSKASKLNFLKAQRDNFRSCGHFTEEEIIKLQAPLLPQIQELEFDIRTQAAQEIIINHFELVKP